MVNSDLYRKSHAFECNLEIIAQEAGEGNTARVVQRASFLNLHKKVCDSLLIVFIFCFIEQTLQDRRIHKVLCNSFLFLVHFHCYMYEW